MTGASDKALSRRVEQLDTVAAVLPIDRRDKLAEILTDQDVETLRHLVNEGMGDNTLRARHLLSEVTRTGVAMLSWPEEPISEGTMAQTSYKISEARKNFAEVLERANQGEEIIIMRGNEIYARIGPADGGKRPFGLLRQHGLPDDLFDDTDAEQPAIDAGDWNDDVGVWQGEPAGREPKA